MSDPTSDPPASAEEAGGVYRRTRAKTAGVGAAPPSTTRRDTDTQSVRRGIQDTTPHVPAAELKYVLMACTVLGLAAAVLMLGGVGRAASSFFIPLPNNEVRPLSLDFSSHTPCTKRALHKASSFFIPLPNNEVRPLSLDFSSHTPCTKINVQQPHSLLTLCLLPRCCPPSHLTTRRTSVLLLPTSSTLPRPLMYLRNDNGSICASRPPSSASRWCSCTRPTLQRPWTRQCRS